MEKIRRSRIVRVLAGFLMSGLLVSLPRSAAAQDTRAATIAAEQEAKAKVAKPYEPGGAEKLFLSLKQDFMESPNGFYPYFASVYSGGGFTLGAGYRQYYGDRTQWNIRGLYSIKSYKFLEWSTDSVGHGVDRFDWHARVGWRDATQVAYYGLGIDSPNNRTNFRLKQAYVGGNIDFRPAPVVIFGAGATYEDFNLEEGQGASPSIETVFTPATAPGLGDNPKYIHSFGSAGIDWRPSPGYARTGGLYQVSYHNYDDRDSVYSFDRVDGEIVQHLPILRENWVLSFHGLVQTTLDDDDIVPYFLLPSLGSGSTLRAYSSWRFRDRHSLLLTGEFRWIPSPLAIDMAIFYDAGKVTSQRSDLDFDGLKSNVGIGIRFHGPLTTPLRIEFAKGDEGWHIVFGGSAAF
ncbi:MAG TPA: hypothetical protein VH702_03360 [Vicinamibacterales bacterium]|jgi:hypothetical protein